MTKLENVEKEYWWEIKTYLENPSKEALVDLLEQVYEDGRHSGQEYGFIEGRWEAEYNAKHEGRWYG